ncbi:hypothetical protein GGR52DRAFT_568473 [Hypoxylon sp. FL1284]|nr:hypothetical protein GGR52DRAFT_568473 [Hypoxylon sp. FL1284]
MESHEYARATNRLSRSPRDPNPDARANPNSRFLLKLEGLLPHVEAAQAVGNLTTRPAKYHGADDFGRAVEFCMVDATAKQSIEKSFKGIDVDFRPSMPPGIDSTMPQHRLQSDEAAALAQDEYPVWYLFDGTLVDKEFLARVLQRDEVPAADLLLAEVRGGRLTTWGGKYHVMVHADPKGPPAVGSAYLIQIREDEDALRFSRRSGTGQCGVVFG